MDLLVTISVPLCFRPSGLELIAFALKCESLPSTTSVNPLLDDREHDKTRWVGRKEILEDDGIEYGVELEV